MLRTSSSFHTASATTRMPMIHAVQASAPIVANPRIHGEKNSHAPSTILIHSVTDAFGLVSAQRDTAMREMLTIPASHVLFAKNQAVLALVVRHLAAFAVVSYVP